MKKTRPVRLFAELFLFSKKALDGVKTSGLQLSFPQLGIQ